MTRAFAAFIAAFIAAGLAACTPQAGGLQAPASAAASLGPAAAEGRAFAERVCADCHALGAGPSPHPDAPTFARLAHRYPPEMLAESFVEGVQVGHPDMPVFQLEAAEVERLVAYLEALRAQPAGR